MRSRSFLTAALPLTILAIAGCGGGDDSSEPAPTATAVPETTALSKGELIVQGDAICAEVNAAIGGLSASEAEGSAGRIADLYVGMVESLKRLGTPQETAGYSEFSSAADALSQAEGEVKLASERGDGAALATAESGAGSALASFQSAAQAYGFEDCGEGPSAAAPGAAAEEPSEEAAEGVEEEAAPEEEVEPAPETGGAGGAEEGGGAEAGGGTGGGGGGAEGGGGSSGGIGAG